MFFLGPKFCPRPPKSPSPSTTIVKCFDRYERTEVDCEIAENHSVVRSVCAPYYEIEGHKSFAICTDYVWSTDKLEKCHPGKFLSLAWVDRNTAVKRTFFLISIWR